MQATPIISKAIFAVVLLLVVVTVWSIVVYRKSPESLLGTAPVATVSPTPQQGGDGEEASNTGAEENVDVDLGAQEASVPTVELSPTSTATPTITLAPTVTVVPTKISEQSEITVVVSDYSFAPPIITAVPSETFTITITNNGTKIHDFVIEDLGVQTAAIQPGSSVVAVVQIPSNPSATYDFYSSIDTDRELGMQGTISVTP